MIKNTILQGDVIDIIKTLLAESINCIITSPPYFGLRNYGLPPTHWPEVTYAPMAGLPSITVPVMSCCLGLEDSIEAYVGHMVLVFRGLWRVLTGDGVAWLNLGDSYAGGAGGRGDSGRNIPRAEGLPGGPTTYKHNGQRLQRFGDLKPKNLIGIPWRVAFALQADGWYLRSEIILAKKNCMPESVKDRPTKSHEQVFLLTKRPRYWYDADAIREEAKSSDRPQPEPEMKTVKPNNTGWLDNRYAPGASGYGVNPAGRNARDVWSIAKPVMKLRDDLTDEQKRRVYTELLRRGIMSPSPP